MPKWLIAVVAFTASFALVYTLLTYEGNASELRPPDPGPAERYGPPAPKPSLRLSAQRTRVMMYLECRKVELLIVDGIFRGEVNGNCMPNSWGTVTKRAKDSCGRLNEWSMACRGRFVWRSSHMTWFGPCFRPSVLEDLHRAIAVHRTVLITERDNVVRSRLIGDWGCPHHGGARG